MAGYLIMSSEDKSVLIEKIVFAVLPVILSGVIYVVTALGTVNDRLSVIEGKINVVVTGENTIRPNQASELSREKLRGDFVVEQNENLIRHTENRGRIDLLIWRLDYIENHTMGKR